MSENELRPCPFCGNEPQEITTNGKPLVVCWCRGCVNDPKNWNTRPIEDALNARIAELEQDLSNKETEYTDLWDDALALQSRIAELEDEIAKMKKYFHKPEHGSCCTCQKCGHIYDECRCDFDETYDENDILTARNAELEAFVNRLIEAGNIIVFETFEGYEKHGLFDFAPVNTWQVLVKDWLVKERER